MSDDETLDDNRVFDGVLGQPDVVKRLTASAAHPVHAYLFLGPHGTGSKASALAFAALLLSEGSEGADKQRHRRLALEATHPDLVIVEPSGTQFLADDVEQVVRIATTSPVEGTRKVIVIEEAQSFNDTAVGRLLKLIEEPPPSTHFVLLATEIPPQMITISSRCLTLEFSPVPRSIIETALVVDGVDIRRAKLAARASGGSLDRARLLAADESLSARAEMWSGIPAEIDGTGAKVAELVHQIREAIDGAQAAIDAQNAMEVEELEAWLELVGSGGGAQKKALDVRHKRAIRRHRTDELRFGLGTLARHYRDRLVDGPSPESEHAVSAITKATDAMSRNPNEPLLLQALLLQLPR